jgi:Flp pilus assembly protein TadD
LALTVLGHYRLARTCYISALALEPSDPVCAHNLGHLEVTQFNAFESGLRWLRIAYAHLPDCREIGASLAHAMVLAGQRPRAEALLQRTLGSHAAAHAMIARWSSETHHS